MRHLERGENEHEGRREDGAGGTVGDPAAEPAPVALPDEDSFTVPSAWRRHLHPRRGGIRRTTAPIAKDADDQVRDRLGAVADRIERMLRNPASEKHLVEAARAHLNGSPDPRGAAVLAAATQDRQDGFAVFADAWAASHGLPFAARAVVELFETYPRWNTHGVNGDDWWIETLPEGDSEWMTSTRRPAADRVRALLAAADEPAYRETVAALAGCRDGARRRVVVSYLVPTEAGWAAECAERSGPNSPRNAALHSMLLCSLGSPEQIALIGGGIGLQWRGVPMDVAATLAEGVGPAFAPLLGRDLKGRYVGTDAVKQVMNVLSQLPGDEAFGILLEHAGDKHARTALSAAARRFPVRALRMLAEASLGEDGGAAVARQLLVAHVAAHRELAEIVLPSLPEGAAAVVAPLTDPGEQVETAPVEALPAVLADPPWTRRRAVAKPRVVTGLVPAGRQGLVWLPGEREEWGAARSWYLQWDGLKDWDKAVQHLREGRLDTSEAVRLFARGPAEQLEPLLAGWKPDNFWDAENWLRPIVARYGLPALPPVLRGAAAQPAVLGPLLLPFLTPETARRAADWLARLKSARATARAWFARHGTDAARLLVPDAVGAPGAARRAAEQALRLVAADRGAEAVRAVAAEYGPEAAEAVDALLAADPLESALPARMPVVGDWADPALLPHLMLRQGGALPAGAVRHVVTMLALSQPGDPYPGIAVVKEVCDPESLTGFAWALFEGWRQAGMPPKDSWALNALGPLGDDGTVRRLDPLVRAWPGQGAHHRAVQALDVLAAIGTDTALLHLHGIAQRVKFKALKARAQEKIAQVAEGLGLTGEQLADRLVPDFGLDADGSTVIDYGPRRFTVGFDEQLRPYVLDEAGKRRKSLPVPGVRDDAELAPAARKHFSQLKKEVRTAAADQVRRFEAAMVTQRVWTAAEFQDLFVRHPLLWHLVRRLVWLGESAGKVTAFRVAEDRTYADVEDETLLLPGDATVRLAHPLHLAGSLDAWSELFADYEILQPFPQLGRPVHALTGEEAAGHRLTRFEGAKVPTGKLLGLQRRGWERGTPEDNGVERWLSRRLGPDCYVVVAPDEGIAVGMVDTFPEQVLETVWLDTRPGDYWPSREHPLRFGDLDPVTASEVLADLTELTSA
ncbi:DUF4132 domain-containing protein [Streptomyces sp. HB2AG]|uniref:DUF4132 domain-containing protein n=1 Tax=Streptomyces sp. HB2AG TaxID=2983400 RepID=UPI0022AA909A|nr:DUF4132 domain-containing protein [Streptomyces sp. HB2AG]MCZ2527989.1 DUF4132 domain-containing protein [Streptomyces sp. HB2AG]